MKRNAHRLKVIEELVAKCTKQQEAIKDLVSMLKGLKGHKNRQAVINSFLHLSGGINEAE